jgi:cephalosporin-C deacetylase
VEHGRSTNSDDVRATTTEAEAPGDLVQFWEATLAAERVRPGSVTATKVDLGVLTVATYDVSFPGYGGTPVRGWLHRPLATASAPGLVEYAGYGGGRGHVHEGLLWASAGFVHLRMDTRGQGSWFGVGDTADPDDTGDPSHPGFLTKGILDPRNYYYRRVFVDAVHAVDALASLDVDPNRIGVMGESQGGGIAIATAALQPRVRGVVADVPFLGDMWRAVRLAEAEPYPEVRRYLAAHRDHVEAARRTLSYFDAAVLGAIAKVPARFSVGMLDLVCPPPAVYATFNAYGGPKEMDEYQFNGHEGGGPVALRRRLDWLRDLLMGAQ